MGNFSEQVWGVSVERHHLLGDAIATARAAGATGQVMVRADSGYYRRDVIAAAITATAWFSVTARMDPQVSKAIAAIPDSAWTTIKYPRAIWDAQEQAWISEAQVAETTFTAFTSHPKTRQVHCRLVVRRVQRLNPAAGAGQEQLFSTWRHHGFITNSALGPVHHRRGQTHRDHAIIEQVIAELKEGPLAHAPTGKFTANAAWLALACIAFNLLRAAGAASTRHAKARRATLHTHLITVPARVATSARRVVFHLPKHWPWAPAWQDLWATAPHPDHPARTAPTNNPDVEEPDRPADSPRPPRDRQHLTRMKSPTTTQKSPSVDSQ